MALIRPEGVTIMALALGALLLRGGASAWRSALLAGGVFAAGGLVYLAWRWSYFGYPLPNPYYKKGGGMLHPDGLRWSVRNVVTMLWPFAPIYLLAVLNKEARRRALVSALAIAAFTCSWVLVSHEMNNGGRFQFPALVIAAISVPGLFGPIRSRWRMEVARRRVAATGALAVLVVTGFASHLRFGRSVDSDHGKQQLAVARALAPYANRNLTVATTEAGRILLYSRWRTIDAWGLNDQWIAHHGGITEDRLAVLDPDVIYMHAYFSPVGPKPPPSVGNWAGMTATLASYAEKRGMQLVFGWGRSPRDTFILYAGPRVPPELVRSLRDLELKGRDYARGFLHGAAPPDRPARAQRRAARLRLRLGGHTAQPVPRLLPRRGIPMSVRQRGSFVLIQPGRRVLPEEIPGGWGPAA
jgi:arabinofuranosyltransferase